MDPLTELVLDMALAQCARWRADGSEVSVSVNLSSTNLHNPRLPQIVRTALALHRLAPSSLVLEITETTAITDFERSQQTIKRLRDLGLVVSVDDFGAGFTSLAYLSSLAVDELKLDRSFIHGLVSSPGRPQPGSGALDDRPGPFARAAGRRRGDRGRGKLRAAHRARHRPGAGLPDQPAATRGRARPARGGLPASTPLVAPRQLSPALRPARRLQNSCQTLGFV